MDVSRIYPHPQYNKKGEMENDFAMLKLKKNVDYARHPLIRPVCLPTDKSETYAGVTATVSGWGTNASNGDLAHYLQEVDVTVLTNEECV